MAKPIKNVTPENRFEAWKKLWATPRRLSDDETAAVFAEFQDGFVAGHMRKYFLKSFGVPKAVFGNRFFMDDAIYRNWDMKISSLAGEGGQIEATVIYGAHDLLEAYSLRGERRRSLHDIVVDDWHASCAIVHAEETTLLVFVEPKMRGCMVRIIRAGEEANGIGTEPS